jgi:hypothetical protein
MTETLPAYVPNEIIDAVAIFQTGLYCLALAVLWSFTLIEAVDDLWISVGTWGTLFSINAFIVHFRYFESLKGRMFKDTLLAINIINLALGITFSIILHNDVVLITQENWGTTAAIDVIVVMFLISVEINILYFVGRRTYKATNVNTNEA